MIDVNQLYKYLEFHVMAKQKIGPGVLIDLIADGFFSGGRKP